MRRDFWRTVQARTARAAIGASALRRQGARGAVAAARDFLASLDLHRFGVANPRVFRARLNGATSRLQRRMPRGARGWGTARKALNIFLRDALYCTYLRDRFRLDRAEALLELPLDSITARQLRRRAGGGRLPRWPGVIKLDRKTSRLYQRQATKTAAKMRIERVHLDAYWWGDRTLNEGRGD